MVRWFESTVCSMFIWQLWVTTVDEHEIQRLFSEVFETSLNSTKMKLTSNWLP